jgi:biotin-(acetyl-CoA carboxylase) ligase
MVVENLFLFMSLQFLDLNVKWPNDIYAGGLKKVGGLLVNSMIEGDIAICNIGK